MNTKKSIFLTSGLVVGNITAKIHSIFVVELLVEPLFVDDAHLPFALMDVERKIVVELFGFHYLAVSFLFTTSSSILLLRFLLNNSLLLMLLCLLLCSSCADPDVAVVLHDIVVPYF